MAAHYLFYDRKKVSPFTINNDDCCLDQLDGETLRNGEKLCIEWPDGHRSVTRVTVEEGYHTSQAYLDCIFHGTILSVRITSIRGIVGERVNEA